MHRSTVTFALAFTVFTLGAVSGCAAPVTVEQEDSDLSVAASDPNEFRVATNCAAADGSGRALTLSYRSNAQKSAIVSVRAVVKDIWGKPVLAVNANVIQAHDSNTISPTMLLQAGSRVQSSTTALKDAVVTQVMLISNPAVSGFNLQGPKLAGQTQANILFSMKLGECVDRERMYASMSLFPKEENLRWRR